MPPQCRWHARSGPRPGSGAGRAAEYHREPAGARQRLLADAPGPTGDEPLGCALRRACRASCHARWQGRAGVVGIRGLRRFWFPFDTPGARRRSCMLRPRSASGRVRRRLRDRRRVSDPSPLLDRAGIEEAFRRLGDRLARRGVVADLYVFAVLRWSLRTTRGLAATCVVIACTREHDRILRYNR